MKPKNTRKQASLERIPKFLGKPLKVVRIKYSNNRMVLTVLLYCFRLNRARCSLATSCLLLYHPPFRVVLSCVMFFMVRGSGGKKDQYVLNTSIIYYYNVHSSPFISYQDCNNHHIIDTILSSSFRGFHKNFGILSSEAYFLLFLGFTREISIILGSTPK